MRYINTLVEGETIRNIYLCKGKRRAAVFQIPGHYDQKNLSRKGDLLRLSGSSGRKRAVQSTDEDDQVSVKEVFSQ